MNPRRATVERLLVAFAVLLPFALGALPASAGFAGVNGRIVFERWRVEPCCVTEVWTMNQDGSQQRRLRVGEDPDWSPDGTQIVFARGRHLIVVRPDGSDERTVRIDPPALAPHDPDWSPDGTQIAFTDGAMYVVSAAGGAARQLATGFAAAPAWSPDGAKIAFLAGGAVWVMNADGSARHALPGARTAGSSGSAREAAWSPDGSTIAYGDWSGGISTVRLDGAEPVQLVPYLEIASASGTYGFEAGDPAWSPDGRRIAFVGNDRDICAVNADGSGIGRLTYAPLAWDEALHLNRDPDWQPLPQGSAPAGPPASRPGPDASWNRNHSWSAACTQQEPAGRSLSGRATPPRVRVGGVLTYRIRLENQGPLPIGELVAFGASLDGGLRILSASATQGRCAWSGRWERETPDAHVECSLGALFPGERASVTLRVRAKTPGELVLKASMPQDAAEVPEKGSASSAPDLLKRTRVLGCTRVGTQSTDVLVGTARIDVLCGLDGDDRLRPGSGRDTVVAGPGDDSMYTRDGQPDRVFCGSGHDSVVADQLDRVGRHCEELVRT